MHIKIVKNKVFQRGENLICTGPSGRSRSLQLLGSLASGGPSAVMMKRRHSCWKCMEIIITEIHITIIAHNDAYIGM